MTPTILRLPEVIKRTGLSKTVLFDLIKTSDFPNSIQLSARCVGWLEEEVNSWVFDRIEKAKVKAAVRAEEHKKSLEEKSRLLTQEISDSLG